MLHDFCQYLRDKMSSVDSINMLLASVDKEFSVRNQTEFRKPLHS